MRSVHCVVGHGAAPIRTCRPEHIRRNTECLFLSNSRHLCIYNARYRSDVCVRYASQRYVHEDV